MAETGERKRDEKQIEAAGEEEPKVRLFLLLTLFLQVTFSKKGPKITLSKRFVFTCPKILRSSMFTWKID